MRPPLLERILSGLPGSRLLWALVLGSVPVAGSALPHSFIATVGEAGPMRRLLAGAAFGYAAGLSVFAVSRFTRQLAEVRESMRAQVPPSGLFKGLSSTAGPVVLMLVFTVVTTVRTAALIDVTTALTWLPVSVITNFCLMSAFWVLCVTFWGLRRLGQHRLSLTAFPEDPSLGLSSVGRLAYTAFWVYAAAAAPILLVNIGEPIRLVMSLCVFLSGVILFFASLLGLHRQLKAARSEHIAWARALYAGVYDRIRSGSSETLEEKAQSLLAAKSLVEDAESIQRWPFEDRRFRQIAAVVGTFVTFTATGIVTRLVALGLGLD